MTKTHAVESATNDQVGFDADERALPRVTSPVGFPLADTLQLGLNYGRERHHDTYSVTRTSNEEN